MHAGSGRRTLYKPSLLQSTTFMNLEQHSVAPFPTDAIYLHTIARALHRGHDSGHDRNHRAPLPPEIVLYIFKLYDAPMNLRSFAISLRLLDLDYFRFSRVATVDVELQRKILCHSSPFDRHTLEKVNQLRLRTCSKDQGWCT